MSEKTISVARDYSPHPGPRLIRQGPHSGEKFRRMLVDALNKYDRVIVDLDGTSGFGSSFLDEVFGGLVRVDNFRLRDLKDRLKIKSDLDFSYKVEAEEAIAEAEQFMVGGKVREATGRGS